MIAKQKSFEAFMSELCETNITPSFFCDFEKIGQNVENIRLSLCELNSLIGATNLRHAVETLWQRDKDAFKVMSILIAVRDGDAKKIVDSAGKCVVLETLFESADGVMEFLTGTGLADLFVAKKINDLVDYVFGVETGLDSNARKNRSGHVMEASVARMFDEAGIRYCQEVRCNEWESISAVLGKDRKRFDFVVKTKKKIFLIEVNFYNTGGSKPNETARSYIEVAEKINSVPGFEFVWITDGRGWSYANGMLREAYAAIPRVYNLSSVSEFIEEVKRDA